MTSHQTTSTLYTPPSPSGTVFAYRRLGTSSPAAAVAGSTVPLLILTHFRGTMDKFDPDLVNRLSRSRQVLLVDYAGVGLSTGRVATSIKQSASDVLEFLSLIGEQEIDLLGFSIGGMVAQLVALNAGAAATAATSIATDISHGSNGAMARAAAGAAGDGATTGIIKIRKLILAGTTPSVGPGILSTPNSDGVAKWAGAKNVTLDAFKVLFFPQDTREGSVAAEQWWDRIGERELYVSKVKGVAGEGGGPGSEKQPSSTWLSDGFADGAEGMKAQLEQLAKWGSVEGSQGEDGSFERLGELTMPVLVVNGSDDYMIPTVNSFVLQQRVPSGQLIVYPRSGHGAIFQYAGQFARDAIAFLEG